MQWTGQRARFERTAAASDVICVTGYELSFALKEFGLELPGTGVADEIPRMTTSIRNLVSDLKNQLINLVGLPLGFLSRGTVERSPARLQMLVDGVRDYAIIMLDNSGRVTSWNRGAEHLQMYSQQDVYGVPFAYFFSNAEIAEGKPDSLLNAARRGDSAETEGWQYRKDGSRFLARVVVSALTEANGDSCGYSVVTQDITRQRQIEQELRTAKEKAEVASQAKTTFLANISHEIRNPLGVILGFSELISDPATTTGERREYAGAIARNGRQLITLIDDLLDLSRAEVNRLKVESTTFNLMALLDDIVYNCKAEMAEKKKSVGLEIEFLGTVPTMISSDPVRIKQILVNLIGNSIKFTERGTIRLQVRCTSINERLGKRKLEFIVRDTGIGIPKDQWDRLFVAFSQADSSMTRRFGGTGLGLALSRQLARMMNGDLILTDSEAGQGSEFHAHIEVELSPHTSFNSGFSSERRDDETVPARCRRPSLEDLKVLVVEDNVENQHLITRILTQANAQVTIAGNGREGLEKGATSQFDVILMDIQMPIMDGYSATRRLRQLNCKTPIIAVTAHAFKEEHARCLQAGFNDHISKPIDWNLLLKKINEFTVGSAR